MNNPICEAMSWSVPSEKEQLQVSLNGRHVATLTSSRNGYFEGLYLINPNGSCYGPCFSIVGKRSVASVKAALANKLRIKIETLDILKIDIVSQIRILAQGNDHDI